MKESKVVYERVRELKTYYYLVQVNMILLYIKITQLTQKHFMILNILQMDI